jgi:hypothetical protein
MRYQPSCLVMRHSCTWWSFNTYQVRYKVPSRGVLTKDGPAAWARMRGPIGSDALADNIVTLNVCDLGSWCNGGIQALVKTVVWFSR